MMKYLKENKKLRKVLSSIFCSLFVIIAGYYITKWLGIFEKKLESEPYIAIVMSRNYPDFRIPIEFLEGFDKASKQEKYIKTKNGKRIKIEKKDDMGAVSEAERIANELVNDKKCILVIGNSNSTLTNKTVDVFLKHSNPPAMILPIATANEITRKAYESGYKSILRMPPNNEEQAKFIAKVAKEKRMENSDHFRVAIFGDLENSFYSENLCRDIARNIRKMGGYIIVEELIGARNSIYPSCRVWETGNPPDIIIYAGVIHNGLLLIDQLSNLGIKKPVIFSDGCMSDDLLKYASRLSSKTFLVSPVVYNYEQPERIPTYTPYGKDTFKLLVNIFDTVDKISRVSINEFIRDKRDSINFDNGYSGSYEFDERGDNTAITYHLYEVTGGKLKYCEMH